MKLDFRIDTEKENGQISTEFKNGGIEDMLTAITILSNSFYTALNNAQRKAFEFAFEFGVFSKIFFRDNSDRAEIEVQYADGTKKTNKERDDEVIDFTEMLRKMKTNGEVN